MTAVVNATEARPRRPGDEAAVAAEGVATGVTTGANVGPHESATIARPDAYVLEIGRVALVAYELETLQKVGKGTDFVLSVQGAGTGRRRRKAEGRTRIWT